MDHIIASRLDELVVSQKMFLVRLSDYIKDISKFQHTHTFHMSRCERAHPTGKESMISKWSIIFSVKLDTGHLTAI